VSAQVAAWRGVDATTPFDVADTQSTNAAALQWSAPGITTTTANATVISVAASSDDNGLDLYTFGACWPNCTTMWSVVVGGINYDTTTGGDHAVGVMQSIAGSQPDPGAKTMFQWNQTVNGSDSWAGITMALRPQSKSCTVTAALKLVSGTTTTLGSSTGTFTSPSSTSGSLVSITITPTSAATFANGDRLWLEVTVPNDATNCNARVHYDGASQQSKLTTATIVPEAVLGLLLMAPALPIAIRRRWIRVPWLERKAP
jgi:hypothetical protein